MVRGGKRIERLGGRGDRDGWGALGLIMVLGPRLREDDVGVGRGHGGMDRGGKRIERLGWLGEREAMLRRD